MAEIDKALPNVEQTINIPNPDEIQVEVEKTKKKPQAPVEVNQNDDGSVDIFLTHEIEIVGWPDDR